jgi:hypothetical protein
MISSSGTPSFPLNMLNSNFGTTSSRSVPPYVS